MNIRTNRDAFKRLGIYILYTLAGLLGLILLTWAILSVYVEKNEQELTRKVSAIVSKRTHGEVSVKGLSVSFFSTFPFLSLHLKDVVVRDSLFTRHRLDLLKAEDIYLRASLPGLISGREPVGKVVVRNGNINLFTDSAGSTNEYVLKSGEKQQKDDPFNMPDIELKQVTIKLENLKNQKLYHGELQSLVCRPTKKKERLIFRTNMRLLSKNVAFNTATGSYLRNKFVEGKFDLVYSLDSEKLLIDRVKLDIEGHPYVFDGYFTLDKESTEFKLGITSGRVDYKKAASILREPLEKKLNEYSISKPISLDVKVSGRTNEKAQPLINVNVKVQNSKVGTPLGEFDECSFEGSFNNQMDPAKGKVDENSLIHLTAFTGKWEQILLKSKNIRISNLTYPFLECDLASDVDLKSLNNLAESASIRFLNGKSSVNVIFKGSLAGRDSIASTLSGEIGIYNAQLKYLPRNFTLSNCEGKLVFENNDLRVAKLKATTGKTNLVMNGVAKNFLSMLDISPEKLVLSWDISTAALHLEDFKSFLSKTASNQPEKQKQSRFASTASKIDKLFAEGDMFINLRTPVMDYKTFKATDVVARVVLKTTEIAFEKVQLKHAGGEMNVSGSVSNGEKFNPVTLHSQLSGMDIPTLFAAFENFGQDAVTHENLSGKLSADVNFRTGLNNDAKLISEANEGEVMFLLENGELNNFQPLIEISNKAFKKQDFSRIKFADLKNRLEVKGTTFIINKMDIRSTALNLSVEGIYDLKKGTDMSITLPVSNLTKSQADTDITENGRAKKGVSLRLRARTGDDGKLKVSWDPFRRAKKKKEEVSDSTQALPEE